MGLLIISVSGNRGNTGNDTDSHFEKPQLYQGFAAFANFAFSLPLLFRYYQTERQDIALAAAILILLPLLDYEQSAITNFTGDNRLAFLVTALSLF